MFDEDLFNVKEYIMYQDFAVGMHVASLYSHVSMKDDHGYLDDLRLSPMYLVLSDPTGG